MVGFSFEFFPPKQAAGRDEFINTVSELAAFRPAFMTVTYGAGGSSREGTFAEVTDLQARTGVPFASHLTYVCHTRQDLFDYTDRLWNAGVRALVALRGDARGGMVHPAGDPDYFHYTSDFVEALRARHDFDISVGAYPEKHPDAPTLAADIDALKKKCDAGATRAITQFFFDNDVFYRFRDQVQVAGIQTPVVPGVMAISHFPNLVNFAGKCGASIPGWLSQKFDGHAPGGPDALKLAADLLTDQCRDLARNGVSHLHVYTMNRADITRALLEAGL